MIAVSVKRASGAFLATALVGCATAPVDSGEPLERCESTDCFNQQQIRNYEIIDGTTLIVYVGAQECPFRVDLIGTFCDITFLPGDIVFRPTLQREAREFGRDGIGAERASIFNARVCANDLSMGIDEGPFTGSGGARVPGTNPFDPRGRSADPSGLDCRIRDVRSLTDDEVLELYVDKEIAPPPPPLGSGQVEVEEPEESTESPDTAARPAADGSPGNEG